jgi:hypothetical protein
MEGTMQTATYAVSVTLHNTLIGDLDVEARVSLDGEIEDAEAVLPGRLADGSRVRVPLGLDQLSADHLAELIRAVMDADAQAQIDMAEQRSDEAAA